MPDLNYDNPAVRKEMISVGQFWLAKGVDGFRLDAAQHIYDNFKTDMDSPVALKQNLVWWSEFERGMRAADPQVWNVGEVARQKPADLVPWFGALDSVFNFPLATGLVDAAKSERLPGRDAIQALARTYAAYRAAAGGRFDDAPFLSNHDQERVMSQLDDNPAHMRVAAAMLLTLPGRPFVYYGEELGMRGEKPDEHLREPMRWYRDGKGPGEPSWEGWSSGDGSAVSVQAEQADPGSLLNYYTMLIHWRSQIGALRDGGFKAYPATNVHLAAWERGDAQGTVLVVHNLSGKKQSLSLDVPGEPHFSHVLRQTGTGAELRDGRISLPPYSSVILQ